MSTVTLAGAGVGAGAGAGGTAHMTLAVLSVSHGSPTEQQSIDAFEFPHSSSPSQVEKKARRQTAYYPHMNSSNKLQKPFSRSAAKRESVMALGSIEHLQHYFTKTGIAARQESLKENKGLVPAIGSATNRPLRPSLSSIQEFHLPPSPAVPVFNRSPYPSIERTYEVDPENLKPGVIRDLEVVAECWALTDSSTDMMNEGNNEGPKLDEPFDVLHALRLTTQLIRSVRNYCVSLPDDSIAEQPNKHKQHFRPSSLQPVPIKRVTSSSYGANANGGGGGPTDPMARIRKLALDVLAALRVLEENARLPLSDEAYDAQSDRVSSQGTRSPEPIQAVLENDELQQQQHLHQQQHMQQQSQQQQRRRHSSSPPHDISFAVSVVTVPGRADAVPVWDDYEDEDDLKSEDGENEKKEKRDIWDERLVLGGGWLYRQDIRLSDLVKDREVVGRYLDAVDEALFEGPSLKDKDGTRGWERAARLEREREAKGRRTSLALGRHREREREDVSPLRGGTPRSISPGVGMVVEAMSNMFISEETESPEHSESETGFDVDVDEDDLPQWAKRNAFFDEPLVRTHTLLFSLLPPSLLPLLPTPYTSPSSRLELLTALSSGQLLCIAYNAGIRRSRKMWGYINKDAIHDIALLELKAMEDDSGGEAQEKRKTGWTFRRIDNLRLWAAALKLRYLVPLTIPAAALSTQQPSIIASTSSNISSSFTPSSTSGPSDATSVTSTSNAKSTTNNGTASTGTTGTTGTTAALTPTPIPTPSPSPSRPITPTPTSPSFLPSHTSPSSPSASSLRPLGGGGGSQTMFIPGKGEVPLIGFDAKLVARREEGWDVMLETVLLEWVRAVVEERRSAR